MRKIFPLEHPRHKPAQAVAAIKHEVRKYIKRERGKKLPTDADFWDFDCRTGRDGPDKVVHLAQITRAIDEAVENGWATVYIEILAKPAKRTRKPPGVSSAEVESEN